MENFQNRTRRVKKLIISLSLLVVGVAAGVATKLIILLVLIFFSLF